jgi:hypothetical protein
MANKVLDGRAWIRKGAGSRRYVAVFWNSMESNARALRQHDPKGLAHLTANWLAEHVIGRDRNGHLLRPGGKLPPCAGGSPDDAKLLYQRGQPLSPHLLPR